MRIVLTKTSDRRHGLELVRSDGSRESVELVTREALFHDLLHYVVESSLRMQGGFWGTLASGKTMADLNDRPGESVKENADTLYCRRALAFDNPRYRTVKTILNQGLDQIPLDGDEPVAELPSAYAGHGRFMPDTARLFTD
jgi:hypothetical protein